VRGLPRAAWVAAGAVGGALVGELGRGVDSGRPIAGVLAIAAAGVMLVSWAARVRATHAMAISSGALLVGCRLLVVAPASADGTELPTGSGPWTARVVSLGAPRNGSQVGTLEIDTDGSPVDVAATLPRYPPIRPELEVRVSGPIEPPADDDYGRYLTQSGVAGTLRSADLAIIGDSARPASVVEGLRRWADDGLARALPEPEAGLASGILIGLRDRVDRDLAASFTTAGVSHVVAISGWNIAIVGATIGALVRRWPRRRRAVVVFGAIVVYTVLTGASSSVLRAAVMAAVVLLARETGRAATAASALGWAIVLLLTVDPAYIRDPGFALSAAATGGLVAWATPMTETIARLGHGRLPGWLAESLGVSFAAELATLPIALFAFGRFAVIAPLVNLFVVPLVAPAMAAGGIALLGGAAGLLGLPTPIAVVAGLPAWAALTAIVEVVRAAASIPVASVILAPPWNLAASLVAMALVVAVANRRRLPALRRHAPTAGQAPRAAHGSDREKPERRSGRRERIAVLAASAMLAATAIVAVNRPDGAIHIHVLDVGQGDAILVDADRGARMLVDGGPDPGRLLVALDSRIPPWDRRIDLVVLTHPHEDHVAGLAMLLARYRIGRVVEPGMLGPGPGYRAWEEELRRRGIAAGRLSTGDRFELDDAAFRVLWPDPDRVPRTPPDTGTAINNVSIVLLGSFGSERFLFAGDIEEEIDPILLARGLPRVEVLKVAHHGSRTSSTDPFLDALRPQIGIVSVGAKNPYGHPAPATIDRLKRHGIETFRTDQNGTVDIRLDGRTATASSDQGDRLSLRSRLPAPRAATAFTCGIRPSTAPLARAAGPPLAAGAEPRGEQSRRPPPSSTTRDLGRIVARRGGHDPASVATAEDGRRAAPAGLYDRWHDGSGQGRGLPPAAVPRPASLGTPARASRRGGGRLARRPDRPQRNERRPATRRERGAPARRRQTPPVDGPGARPPPRCRLRGVAHGAWPS
jgi:competence protein ComEC